MAIASVSSVWSLTAVVAFFISVGANAGVNTDEEKPASKRKQQAIDQLWNMPLADLLQVRVTVASGEPESIAEAAGTVTSYAAQDINAFGLNTLAELASLTPGYSTYHNIGENTLETRGQKASGFDNNRHLLLIDGIPANHIRAYTAPVDYNLPLHFANQIDFLRGPASALYGVSAFYGVISIDPLIKARHSNQADTAIQLQASGVANSVKINQFINTDTAQGMVSASLYTREASLTAVANSSSHLNYDDQTSQFAYTKWQWDEGSLDGLTAGAMYSSKKGGLGNFWSDYSSKKNEITWTNVLGYVKYAKPLSAAIESHSYLKYAYSAEAATYYNATESQRSHYDYPFHSYQTQTELHWNVQGEQHIIAGINLDSRYGEEKRVEVAGTLRTTPQTPTVFTQSYYVQYKNKFDVLEGSLLTLGARLDSGKADNEGYRQLSPRIAFVQKVNPWLSVKALYAEALRGPSVKELGVNNEVRIEQPAVELLDLQPETIQSVEFAPYIETDAWLVGVTFYSNTTSHYLARDWSRFGEYVNIEQDFTSKGVELEINYAINQNAKLFINAATSSTRDNAGNPFLDVPRKKLNLGGMWSALRGVPLSGAITFTTSSDFDVPPEQQPFKQPSNGETFVNINIAYPLNKATQVALNVTNVLNETAYWRSAGASAVQMPGREARVDVTFSF